MLFCKLIKNPQLSVKLWIFWSHTPEKPYFSGVTTVLACGKTCGDCGKLL
jgi:hypothetical protein